jgi:hypothetical protein
MISAIVVAMFAMASANRCVSDVFLMHATFSIPQRRHKSLATCQEAGINLMTVGRGSLS